MASRLLLTLTAVLLLLTTSVLWLSRGGESGAEMEPAANIGGSFELTDQNGKTVRDTDFRVRSCPLRCATGTATGRSACLPPA